MGRSTDETPEKSGSPGDATTQGGLTKVEAAILEMEQGWWKYQGAKETAVRERFGMSLTRYYQVLNTLIDQPAAPPANPVTVNRLRRLRAERQRQRSASRDQDSAS